MSRPSSNQISYNYNIDKLNFSKIKKELETIPNIIKNHNKIGLRPCISMTDIYNNEHINNTSNNLNEESDIPLIKNIKQNPKAFSSKKPSIFKNKYNNSNNNINNKNLNTSINDEIIPI